MRNEPAAPASLRHLHTAHRCVVYCEVRPLAVLVVTFGYFLAQEVSQRIVWGSRDWVSNPLATGSAVDLLPLPKCYIHHYPSMVSYDFFR